MQFEMYLYDELQDECQICNVVLDYYEEGFEGDNEEPPYPEVFEFTVQDSGGERSVGSFYDPYNEYGDIVRECRRLASDYYQGDCDEVVMERDL